MSKPGAQDQAFYPCSREHSTPLMPFYLLSHYHASLVCMCVCVGERGLIWFCPSLYYNCLTYHLTKVQVAGLPWLIFPCAVCTHTGACKHGQTRDEHACYWRSLPVAGGASEADTPGWKVILTMWQLCNQEESFDLLSQFICTGDQTSPWVAVSWANTQAHWPVQFLICLLSLHLSFFPNRILRMFR